MKIVAISDTHGKHRGLELPEGDALIFAGDMMSAGKAVSELLDFNDWLGDLDFEQRIVVAGNHDSLFEQHPALCRTLLTNGTYIQDEPLSWNGLHFYGSPVTPAFMDWSFNRQRGADIRRYWDAIPECTDVLITHGPPLGILDQSRSAGEHLGCADLADAVRRIRPRLHIFGHIHGGSGVQAEPETTTYVNAAVLDETYHLVNPARVITL